MTNLPEGTITLHVKNPRKLFLFLGNTILLPYLTAPVTFSTLDQVRYFVYLQQKGYVTTNDPIPADVVALLDQSGGDVPQPAPVVTISVPGGVYTAVQTITLTPNVSTTTIYYTVDGSTPTTTSNIYNAPIQIGQTTTLKYFAKDATGATTPVQTVTYTIVITPAPGGGGGGPTPSTTNQDYMTVAEEPFSGTANVTHTFAKPMDFFVIHNDDATNPLSFTIGSDTVTVEPKASFSDRLEPFTSVTVTTTVAFRAYGKRITGTTNLDDYVVADGLAGSTNATKTFTGKAREIILQNSGSASLTIVVNGFTFTVNAGEMFNESFTAFQSVTVNATTPFEAYFKGIESEISPDVTPPSNVTANPSLNITSTSLRLSWNAVTDADLAGYNVYNGATKLNTALLVSTLFDVTSLTPGTSYTFKVTSVDKTGNESSGTSITASTLTATLPNDVTGLVANNVTSSSMVLSWLASTSTNVQGYQIYQNTTLLATVSGTNYTVTSLAASTTYEFTVKTVDKSGNISIGVSVTQTTSPSSPTALADVTNLATSSLTSTSVTLTWTASTSANIAAYDIYNGTTVIGTTTSTSYNVTGLSIATAYTLKVITRDNAGNTSSGATVSFTTLSAGGTRTILWQYDFQVPQSVPSYNLKTDTNFAHTLTNADIYGPALDGNNATAQLLELGPVDGQPDEPGQVLPRKSMDTFTAPSMHGAYQYDDSVEVIYFDSMAMNPYYFRIIKYSS